MQIFESVFDGKQVTVVIDDPWQPCCLRIEYLDFAVVKIDDTFANAIVLSAFLESGLGLGAAIDFLESHGVARSHPLWHLNHSDLWIRT